MRVFYVGNSHLGPFMPIPRLAKLVGHEPYETKQAMILGALPGVYLEP